MFDHPDWQALELKRVRYIVPWDWAEHDELIGEVGVLHGPGPAAQPGRARDLHRADAAASRTAAIRATRTAARRRPGPTARPSGASIAQYPWVKTYSAWNEVNHKSQPTYRSPSLAVRYYEVLRKDCRSRNCRVMAIDLLDERNMSRYLARASAPAPRAARACGACTTTATSTAAARRSPELLRTVPGEVWLTETGGIVTLRPELPALGEPRGEPHAGHVPARRPLRHAAARPSAPRSRGCSSTSGSARTASARFDAGLVDQDGSPRKALDTFARIAPRHR